MQSPRRLAASFLACPAGLGVVPATLLVRTLVRSWWALLGSARGRCPAFPVELAARSSLPRLHSGPVLCFSLVFLPLFPPSVVFLAHLALLHSGWRSLLRSLLSGGSVRLPSGTVLWATPAMWPASAVKLVVFAYLSLASIYECIDDNIPWEQAFLATAKSILRQSIFIMYTGILVADYCLRCPAALRQGM